MTVPLCKTCRYFWPLDSASNPHGIDVCLRHELQQPNLVRGGNLPMTCQAMRMDSSWCGPDGRFWEAK